MTGRDPRGLLPPLIAFLLFLAAAGPAAAARSDSVSVEIGVVVASNKGSSIDPSLSSLRAKLQSMFTYTSYTLLDRKRRSLAVGETGDFSLPGGRSIRVTPAPASGSKVRLAVQIMDGGRNLLTTTLGLSRGGMVLVGGPPHQSGVLILLISAE
ncbi:MAG: hypothetical protein HY896_01915 [Deltaproteobacteria bacterium]|nr:hypothetical protein [Deltaproteobacteria bacterium]